MNKIKSISKVLPMVLSLAAVILTLLNMKNDKTIYFVNNGKLYDGFTLKVNYENQIQTLRTQRKNMLDSLELNIQQLEARQMEQEARYAKEFYIRKVKTFEEEENNLLGEYNQQIWERLNTYAEEFSKEKNIDILFGASGNGTLLHADAAIDLTDELIQFANKRFSGK